MSGRASPIVNVDALETTLERREGSRFAGRQADVGGRIGARRLGYNVTRLEPGCAMSPFHSHHVGEEMFFVMEGSGTLRFGDQRHPVRQGDFIACPPGGSEVAHQLIAGPDGQLVFLAVGTRVEADVWSYPDSGKWGVVAGRAWDGSGPAPAGLTFANRYVVEGSEVDYWTGE
ncbi:MAG: cupin domain-containing protein [Caldimonas sp.]